MEEETSLDRQRWALQFKDATSAAQAAAESAERASMAARAAVELASRGDFSEYSNSPPEPSTQGPRYEARNLTASKSQDESQHRDPVNRNHKTGVASSAGERIRNVVAGGSEPDQAARDHRRVNDSYTNPRRARDKKIDSPTRESSSEDDAKEVPRRINRTSKDDSLGRGSEERHTIKPGFSPFGNHSDDEGVSVSDIRKSGSYTRSVKAESVHQNFKTEDRADSSDARQEGIERKLRKASSSRSSSVDPEPVWDSPMKKKSFDQNTLFDSDQEINQAGSSYDPPALFDSSGSDNDEHLEIDHIFEKHESEFHESSLDVGSSTRHKQKSGSSEDGFRSFLRYLPTQPVESSGKLAGETSLSLPDAVAYKETSSDSEDGTREVGDSGDKASNTLYRNQSIGSSLKSSVKENSTDKSLPPPPAASSEPHWSNESGEGLKLERLTGGLKNKGYFRPPYLSSTVVNESLTSDTLANDSSAKPTASSRDKMATFSSVQKTYVSDSSDSDDLEQHPASERSGRRSAGSLLSTSRSDDHHLADEKKFSSTSVGRDGDELDQGASYQRPVGRSPRKLSHTVPAASIDKYPIKEIPPPGKQDTRGAPASILSDQKPEDTRAAASDVVKTSIKTSKGSKQVAIPYFDDDEDKDEVVLPPRRTIGSVGMRSGRVSQRTRSPRVAQASSSLRDSGSPDSETTALPSSTISVKSETAAPLRRHQETVVSVPKDSSGSSKSSLPFKGSSPTVSRQTGIQAKTDDQKSSESERGSISREKSTEGAPHVHPRLPDYETLAAHFHSLRSNRR